MAALFKDPSCHLMYGHKMKYQWGECVKLPSHSPYMGPKFVRLYPERSYFPSDEEVLFSAAEVDIQGQIGEVEEVEEEEEFENKNRTIMWILISGIIFLTLVILCLLAAMYQLSQMSKLPPPVYQQ